MTEQGAPQQRRKGTSKLTGRPLDDNGSIELTSQERIAESNWVTGAKFGWNCAQADNVEAFNLGISAHSQRAAASLPESQPAPSQGIQWLAYHALKSLEFERKERGNKCYECNEPYGGHGEDCMIGNALNPEPEHSTESQPSPSGDELLWEFMEPFIGPTGGWLVSPKRFHAAIAEWLRAHDAKGQAEQGLRDVLHGLVQHFRNDFEDPGLELYGLVNGKELCAGGQMLNKLLAEAEAALKEPR